jgi:di/tricarboxylate transporter
MPSITARAGGVMLPITNSISEVLGSHPNPETRKKVGRYLIMCAFHANIVAASMFITAMAGNPLVVKLAADRGVNIRAHRAISWVIFEMFLQFRQARGQDFQLEILLVA